MTPDIGALLSARSFAVIGASDSSTFSTLVFGNLARAGLADRVYLVNPRSPQVHGRSTFASCVEVGQPIDLAFVMVSAARVPAALRDAAAAGARGAIVLSSGYAEAGPEGVARQAEIVALADELGLTVLGPNVLGFINALDGIPAMALSDPPTQAGGVALISQSGASCGAMKDFAAMSGVGLSHVLTVGNEAMVTIADLVDHLVDDERVKAIAIFMEAIAKPEVFARAAVRASRAGKPIVVLKAGRSELAARAAASHTGALVGDDRVIDSVFRQIGVIRVDTVEDMLVTAGLGAYTGPVTQGGLGVVSISGGACDIVADLAEAAGIELPQLAPATVDRLADRLPAFGHAHNPLDITGAAITDPQLWTDAIGIVAADPSVAVVAAINSLPWREDGQPFYGQKYVDAIGRGFAAGGASGLYVTQVNQPLGPQASAVVEAGAVPYVVTGLRAAVDGFARIAEWSDRRSAVALDPVGVEQVADGSAEADAVRAAGSGVLSERASREILSAFGVPMVPAYVATSAAEAEQMAGQMAGPLALKVVSADIAHKSDVGGVRLSVSPERAAEVFAEIVDVCAAKVPGAVIDGVMLAPMRAGGTELLVGVTRNPDWGLVLAVGFGGVLVEVLDDVALARLPLRPGEAADLLTRLRGRALFEGVRGSAPVDLERLAELIEAVARAAVALGSDLVALELNPVRVSGSEVEALDALVVMAE